MQDSPDARRDSLERRLRAAGCVRADEEADLLLAAYSGAALEDAVRRRERGTPLEQVLGRADFAGVTVALDPGVFVPRRRAEALVDTAVDAAAGGPDHSVLLDLGCGSGAIAAALIRRLPAAEVLAADADPVAVACARRNGETFGFDVYRTDWFDGLPGLLAGRIDVAVAYLPHVPTAHLERLDRDYRDAAPPATVHGGADGLDPLRAVLAQAPRWLAPRGTLITLLAAEQRAGAAALAATGGWSLVVVDDDEDLVVRISPVS